MFRRLLAAAAAAGLLAGAGQAMAGIIDLTFTGSNVFGGPLALASANLQLTYDDSLNSFGGHFVTAISGDVDGDALVGVLPFEGPSQCACFSEGYSALDGLMAISNTVYDSGDLFDHGGLGFKGAVNYYNLYALGGGAYELFGLPRSSTIAPTSPDLPEGFSVSDGTVSVPEPQAWALMILGFGAVGAAMRRRAVRPAVPAAA